MPTETKQKGSVSITAIIGWGLTIGIASVGFTMSQISKVSDAQTNQVQRISVVETKATQYEKDIESINKKLDQLIEQKTLTKKI